MTSRWKDRKAGQVCPPSNLLAKTHSPNHSGEFLICRSISTCRQVSTSADQQDRWPVGEDIGKQVCPPSNLLAKTYSPNQSGELPICRSISTRRQFSKSADQKDRGPVGENIGKRSTIQPAGQISLSKLVRWVSNLQVNKYMSFLSAGQ